MSCIYCRLPMRRKEFIRPGGLPIYFTLCDCEAATYALQLGPLVMTSIEEVGWAATIFPDAIRYFLMRSCAA